MNYIKTVLLISLVFILTVGCSNDASLGKLSNTNGAINNNDAIEPIKEGLDEIDSEGGELTDEEITQENTEEVVVEEVIVEEEAETDRKPDEESEQVVDNEEEQKNLEEEDLFSEQCKRRGNLLVNGSFEISDNRKGMRGKTLSGIKSGGWDIFQSLPSKEEGVDSWYTTDGSGIEIQGHKTVVKNPHGDRSIELDSHGTNSNSSMSQRVYLCKGKYVLKFAYYPRTSKKDDNIISVRLNDIKIKTVNKIKNGKWRQIRKAFKVKERGFYEITFSAEGVENSLGGLIDHVRLHRKVKRAGVVTSLIALGDKDNTESPLVHKEISKAVVVKMVNFASIKKKPNIVLVKDRGHNGESKNDFSFIKSILIEKYGEEKVRVINGDLELRDAEEADLIYVINPGYPLKSRVTASTIREIKKIGKIGVILSGDDISRGAGFKLEDITGAKYLNNGTKACGMRIDNNKSDHRYSVKLKKKHFNRLKKKERQLTYGNDIDHVKITKKGVRVLAKAQVAKCGLKVPAIFGYKLKRNNR